MSTQQSLAKTEAGGALSSSNLTGVVVDMRNAAWSSVMIQVTGTVTGAGIVLEGSIDGGNTWNDFSGLVADGGYTYLVVGTGITTPGLYYAFIASPPFEVRARALAGFTGNAMVTWAYRTSST